MRFIAKLRSKISRISKTESKKITSVNDTDLKRLPPKLRIEIEQLPQDIKNELADEFSFYTNNDELAGAIRDFIIDWKVVNKLDGYRLVYKMTQTATNEPYFMPIPARLVLEGKRAIFVSTNDEKEYYICSSDSGKWYIKDVIDYSNIIGH